MPILEVQRLSKSYRQLGGETTVEGEFAKAPDTGIIAFQIHSGGPMEVVFRNLRFKDLSK